LTVFANLSIGKKISYGFAAILALTLGGVSIAGFGISSVASGFNDLLTKDVAAVRHIRDAKIALLEARRPEKDLLYADDPTLIVSGNKSIQAMLQETALAEKVCQTIGDEGLLGKTQSLSKAALQYQKAFADMVAAPIGQDRMVATLAVRKTAKVLETDLNEVLTALSDRIELNTQTTQSHANSTIEASMAVGGIAVLIGIFLAVTITRAVTRPLERMKNTIMEVQRSGDFSKSINYRRSDEIGQAARAFDALMEALARSTAEVNKVVVAVAAGDFSQRIEADLPGDLKVMKDAVNASVQSVKLTMDGLNAMMKALYHGDFSAHVAADVQGEFKLAFDQAAQAMQALQTMLGDAGQVMTQAAQGNLTGRIKSEGRGDLQRLKEDINVSLEAFSRAMVTINNNTQQVAAATSETSTAIGQISDGAQSQTHAVRQVSSAVRQTATAISDVSSNTEAASQKSQQMVAVVERGAAKMALMVDVVNSIATNSERINKITEAIEAIANKTNLLSLNAAIEAARAGEHGKGFAVVADEVGKLAVNSAESAQEIVKLVEQAVRDAIQATDSVREVAADMDVIRQAARESNEMLYRITTAIEQQNATVQEIETNVTSLARIAEANASASEEIAATVVDLSKVADATRREVARFRT
jgi:methyl-accepting chemotaxis protein